MWIYARSGELWVKQAELSHPIGKGKPGELEATEFGEHIAVSGDGKTAVVSDSAANKGKGAIFVYTRVGETWSQQAELRGTPVSGKGVFCQALAISVDGSTIVAGGPYDHGKRGSIGLYSVRGNLEPARTEDLPAKEGSSCLVVLRATRRNLGRWEHDRRPLG